MSNSASMHTIRRYLSNTEQNPFDPMVPLTRLKPEFFQASLQLLKLQTQLRGYHFFTLHSSLCCQSIFIAAGRQFP